MKSQEQKQYYAFISYKREDKKEAKRLQHTLEYYKLPNKLRQDNPDLPEYVRPIFRDMTNLEVGELSAQIHVALELSHFLIVVCSPRAAKSKWVNDEVDYFISLGKQDKIIPYIIEGFPHADNSDEECYPPALLSLSKEKELLGANINEVGKNPAIIRVVARMFDIRFDTLYQRYQREQRTRYFLLGIAISIIVSLLTLFLIHEIQTRQKIQILNNNLKETNEYLQKAKDTIIHKNEILDSTNIQLTIERNNIATERDKVKAANWKMLENQSRATAAIASQCLKDGNIRLATLLALEVLPKNIQQPNRPWTIEADLALREASSFTQYMGHTDYVTCATFSPDGRKIASSSCDYTIRVWDAEKIETLHTLKGHTYYVTSVSYSPDNIHIASSSGDGTVRIWNTITGESEYVLLGDEGRGFLSVAYSPQGNVIAAVCNDCKIYIWDVNTYKLTLVLQDENGLRFRSVAFDKDGNRIVTAAKDTSIWDTYNRWRFASWRKQKETCSIQIWNAQNGKLIRQMKGGHGGLANYAEFSPDGSIIASVGSRDSIICIWNAETGDNIRTYKYPSNGSYALNFSPNGERLVCAYDDKIQVWNTVTDESIGSISCHSSFINSVKYSNDGHSILSSSADGSVSLWNDYHVQCDNQDNKITFDHMICAHGDNSIEYTPDSTQRFEFNHNNICIYDRRSNQCILKLNNIKYNSLMVLNYSPDHRRIAALNEYGSVYVWDTRNGVCVYYLQGNLEKEFEHTKTYRDTIMSPRNIVNSCRRLTDLERKGYNVSFSADGNDLIVDYPDANQIIKIPPIQEVINIAQKRYHNCPLTKEEKRKYYLE
ncbi:MAG: TIR domain-containing protein [Paludibacteraceae bacterium]|nr:TIR domain-containing protein [Paludibacteraceae bacterium]